ncbi:MAG: hypothetical protein ACM3WU_07895 [Bacillota bacterium]
MVHLSRKISVYVDDNLHRLLKSAASLRGISLSDLMVDAAKKAIQAPTRKEVASRMDALRRSVTHTFTSEEIRSMREEGRRVWPRE